MHNKSKLTVDMSNFSSLGSKSSLLKEKIDEYNLQYYLPTKKERDEILLKICKFLLEPEVVKAGQHRKSQWEDGWQENLEEYKKNKLLENLVPKYFDKYKVQRINGELIIPISKNFEIALVSLIQYAIFDNYFKDCKNIYEFGAGTGHNLLRLREINPKGKLYSMEWAKSGVELINLVAKNTGDSNLHGRVFDNFNPDRSIHLEPESSVYTFASLEQLGEDTDAIIEYWIENKVNRVVNVEPMAEPLDDNELLQFLSVKYFEKRNYLKNYIKKLQILEKSGVIQIHEISKTGFGSLFIEGYSIVSWSPLG